MNKKTGRQQGRVDVLNFAMSWQKTATIRRDFHSSGSLPDNKEGEIDGNRGAWVPVIGCPPHTPLGALVVPLYNQREGLLQAALLFCCFHDPVVTFHTCISHG